MRSMKVLFTLLGGFLGFMLGGVDAFLYTLIAFVAIDYISGVLVAICEKKVSSKVGARGISKKIMLFALIAVANLIDCNLTNTSVLRTATIFFYMSNELISILENADKLGLPVPEKLRNILEQFKKK
jgi:toxin secretion/phage lysis holin